MAESFLLARLGNCNILFHNILPSAKTQLQKIQNTTLAFALIFMSKSSIYLFIYLFIKTLFTIGTENSFR